MLHAKLIIRAFCALSLLLCTSITSAQEFPTRALRIVSPYSTGGGNDRIARMLAEKLAKVVGQHVLVDNRPGANTMIGNDYVAKSAPDGYTLILNGNGFVINPSFYRTMTFDTVKDIMPVSFVGFSQLGLVVSPTIEPKNVKALLEYIHVYPGRLNFGTSGYGGPDHFASVIFNQLANVKVEAVPYKGSGPALADLLGSHVQMMMAPLPIVHAHIKSGKLKLFGVATKTRSAAYPDVPSLDEAGIPGYEAFLWYGLMTTGGTPQAVIKKLAASIQSVLNEPDTLEWFRSEGLSPATSDYDTPEKFSRFVRTALEQTAAIAKAMNIQPE